MLRGTTRRAAGSLALSLAMLAPGAGSARAQDLSVMVPMRDGTLLAADVYLPPDAGPWPAVLVRTPYNKSIDSSDPEWVQEVNDHGYAYVVQDLRGRFSSGGTDSTFWTDGWGANQDGYDTIEWVAAQSWCDGNVGTYGESGRGIVQYLAAGAAPPSLKCCLVRIACEDFYHKAFFQGGELRKALVERWFTAQGSTYMLPFFYAHPTRDAFWDQLDLATRASNVTVPILHIGGHYDIFGDSTIDAFNLLQAQGGGGAAGNQKLVMGPWSHININMRQQGELNYPANAVIDLETLRWRWFDRWLKGEPTGIDEEPPISCYVMGAPGNPASAGNIWLDLEEFPPPEVVDTPLYVHGHDSPTPLALSPSPSPVGPDVLYYQTDPRDPIPTRGGRNMYLTHGPFDQYPVQHGRADGIEVATPPLVAPVTVMGKIRFHFWAECSAVDTDWVVKLMDLYPDGRKMLVTDGVLKARFRNGFGSEQLLSPWGIYEYEVDLWSTAIAFDIGHRILVTVGNSNYTRFELNPQTGAPFGSPADTVAATVGIWADAAHPSRLILPVLFGSVDVAGQTPQLPSGPLTVSVNRNPSPVFVFDVTGSLSGEVTADIFSVGGRRIRALTGEPIPGYGTRLIWNGVNAEGRSAASGVYVVMLRDDAGNSARRRVVLVR